FGYRPDTRPSHPPSSAPTMPSTIVMASPPGCGPGTRSLDQPDDETEQDPREDRHYAPSCRVVLASRRSNPGASDRYGRLSSWMTMSRIRATAPPAASRKNKIARPG